MALVDIRKRSEDVLGEDIEVETRDLIAYVVDRRFSTVVGVVAVEVTGRSHVGDDAKKKDDAGEIDQREHYSSL